MKIKIPWKSKQQTNLLFIFFAFLTVIMVSAFVELKENDKTLCLSSVCSTSGRIGNNVCRCFGGFLQDSSFSMELQQVSLAAKTGEGKRRERLVILGMLINIHELSSLVSILK